MLHKINLVREHRVGVELLVYKSSIKTKGFLFKEFAMVIELINSGKSTEEIRGKVIDENLFQISSVKRRKEILSTILLRIEVLDEFLINKSNEVSVEGKKLIALYSLMKTDELFFEFMRDVYSHKISVKDYKLMSKDLDHFLEVLSEKSDIVNRWSKNTCLEVKIACLRILSKAGLLLQQQKEKVIQIPIIDNELKKYISSIGDKQYIDILEGVY